MSSQKQLAYFELIKCNIFNSVWELLFISDNKNTLPSYLPAAAFRSSVNGRRTRSKVQQKILTPNGVTWRLYSSIRRAKIKETWERTRRLIVRRIASSTEITAATVAGSKWIKTCRLIADDKGQRRTNMAGSLNVGPKPWSSFDARLPRFHRASKTIDEKTLVVGDY